MATLGTDLVSGYSDPQGHAIPVPQDSAAAAPGCLP